MENKVRYCMACGSKLHEVETGRFNYKTGNPETYLACPTNICGHTGIHHDWQPTSKLKRFLFGQEICTKCKKIGYDY